MILFAYLDKIDARDESVLIEKLERMIDRGKLDDEIRKIGSKDFEHVKVESVASSTTDENFIASATISIAFVEMSVQFCLKRNQHTPSKKGRIVAFAISRPIYTDSSKLDDDIKEIIKMIRKKDVDGLVAKENSMRMKLKFNEKMKNYNSAEEMYFKDKEEPIPTFGEICFYDVSAIKKNSTSLPARLSVILLDRSK